MPAKKQPAQIRQLHTGKAPVQQPLPRLDDLPVKPEGLSEEAGREWDRVTGLTKLGWLRATDTAALVAYCESWSAYLAAVRDIATRGTLVDGRSSSGAKIKVKNPSLQTAREAGAALRAWTDRLGFNPASRDRAEPVRTESPLANRTAARIFGQAGVDPARLLSVPREKP